jgi:hypothetical protein
LVPGDGGGGGSKGKIRKNKSRLEASGKRRPWKRKIRIDTLRYDLKGKVAWTCARIRNGTLRREASEGWLGVPRQGIRNWNKRLGGLGNVLAGL